MHNLFAVFYRMTILFFGLSGLDVLDSLSVISDEDRAGMVDWIYSQQILPNTSGSNLHQCGFRGASFIGAPFHSTASSSQVPSPDLLCLEVIGINEGVCCLSTYIAVKFIICINPLTRYCPTHAIHYTCTVTPHPLAPQNIIMYSNPSPSTTLEHMYSNPSPSATPDIRR